MLYTLVDEDVGMKNNTAYHFQTILDRSCRKPVLTAMMVIGSIFVFTGSIAGVAVWRASSTCAMAENPAPQNPSYGVVDPDSRGDPQRVEAVAQATCPCSSPLKWHWQLI